MLRRDLEAAPHGTAVVLEVIESFKKSSGSDFTQRFDEMRAKIDKIPEKILHVALKIYLNQLSKDAYLHPNYFINTALKINRTSIINKKQKPEDKPASFTPVDIGKGI